MTVHDPFDIVGTTIAEKYVVEKAMDEGGFSVVYRARHIVWEQPVALKCIKSLQDVPETQRDKILQSFVQEGKLLATLSQRTAAIVQARDVGTFVTRAGQWVPYMVLEWLDGRPLDAVLWDELTGRMPARDLPAILKLLDQAAVAIELAHARSIAHRDIKPGNFFVIGDPRGADAFVKVLDFGIAKVMQEHAAITADKAQTGKEVTSFTPNYGAPEQFSRTHGATGPWTDVFAMALVVVELLRGGTPALEGDEFLHFAVASRDPTTRPTPRRFGVPVSDEVEAVLAKALAVNPVERFRTMGEFWSALSRAAGAGAWSAPSTATSPPRVSLTPETGVPSQAQTAGGLVASPTAPTAVPPQASRSHGALFGAIAAIAALGAGGAAAWKFAGTPPSPTAAATGPTSAPTPSAPMVTTASATSAPKAPACGPHQALVGGGRFNMGSDAPGLQLSSPVHEVTVDSFCIDLTEVTTESFTECVKAGKCREPAPKPDYPPISPDSAKHLAETEAQAELCNYGKADRGKHPINCVDFEQATTFCAWKDARLPTEAEWEYAARGGTNQRKFPWGDDQPTTQHINACGLECTKWESTHPVAPTGARMYEADDGYAGTAPVASFPKGQTKHGAYDMVGNVWEWTHDWYATYKKDPLVNPQGAPAGEKRAIRGGGYTGAYPMWLDPAFRYHQVPTARTPGIGFRCAKSLG
jgi:formylglycine-generating enzyme required for sulfatase activity/serine/threonine protein kinase